MIETCAEEQSDGLVAVGLAGGDKVRWRSRDGGSWVTGRVVGLERDGSVSCIDDRGNWRAIRPGVLCVRVSAKWLRLDEVRARRVSGTTRTRRSIRREERVVREYLDCIRVGHVSPVLQGKFIESARKWAEFRGVTAEALVAVGVPKAILQSAGVPVKKGSRGGSRPARASH